MYSKLCLIIFIILLILSCSLIDLSELDVSIYPSIENMVLDDDKKISISFSDAVDKTSAESLFNLEGPAGTEPGDFNWSGNILTFIPQKAMQPGFRYVISFKGNLKTVDKRSFEKNIIMPFYYITDDLPPILINSYPENASIIATSAILRFSFNKPLDQNVFEEAFILTPGTDCSFDWNNNSTAVEIGPENKWTNMQYYNWLLSSEIIDKTGIPLPEEISGSFLVQADPVAPEVTFCCPAGDDNDGNFTLLTELTADNLDSYTHLAFGFSEAIEFNSLKKVFSINPTIDGYLLSLSPDTVLYYITEKLHPSSSFTVKIGAGIADISGNPSMDDWVLYFSPDVRALEINTVEIEDQNGINQSLSSVDFNNSGFITTPGLDYLGTSSLHFIIHLSEDYSETETNARLAFESTVNLTSVFPPGITSPNLFASVWEMDDRLRLIYNGLSVCTPEAPIYYRMRISAGNSDSANLNGSFLTEDIEFTILAEIE